MARRDLIDLRYDASFKALFENDEHLLLSFINSIIEDRNIVEIEELNTNIKPVDSSRGLIFDILVRDSNGTKINIEMEKNSTNMIKKRTQFYWSKAFAKDIKKGDKFTDLKDTICINILGKSVFTEDEDVTRRFVLYDIKHTQRLDTSMDIYFVELDKGYKNLSKKLELWVKLISDSSLSDNIRGKDEDIDKAITKVEEISMNDEILDKVLTEQQIEIERDSRLAEVKQQGVEEGLIKALQKMISSGIEADKAREILGIGDL